MAVIGVTDSGAGGLSVLKALYKKAPENKYIFLADTAHAPYGARCQEEIISLAESCVDNLILMGADIVVLACNTATSAAADYLRKKYSYKIVGAEPAIMPAVREGKRRILCLATPFTIASERYLHLIEPYRDKIIDCSCGDLATFIDACAPNYSSLKDYVGSILKPFKGVDAIVLGCTHYALIKPLLKRFLPCAAIYDGTEGIARRVMNLSDKYCSKRINDPQIVFKRTDDGDISKFIKIFSRI